MKKVLSVLAGAILLFGSAGIAFASNPVSYHFGTITPPSGPDYSADLVSPAFDGTTAYLIGFDPVTGDLQKYWLNSGLFNSGGQIDAIVPITNVVGLNDYINDFNGVKFPFLYSAIGSATSSIFSINSALGTLSTTVSNLATPLNIAVFMGSNASTSPYIASSTQNGFLSYTDKVKLDSINTSWVSTTTARSLVTGTGATGFQVSSTRNATGKYNVKVTTTASIAGSADGYIALELAPTNSATPTDWIEEGRCGNSQALSLAIALQSVQGNTCQLVADIPAGYFAKLRSVTSAGTVSFTSLTSRETLK